MKIIEHVWIPLADGTRLSAKLWLPENHQRQTVPAILEYLPYRKRDGTATRDALTHPYFCAHGYACVRVDIRGSGESEGLLLDEYPKQEQDDALEILDWIVAQPWCSGAIGMMGISWGGFNGLQVAARRPPALKAIITLCSTDDRYADDIHYKGGALLLENLGWAATMFAYQSRPPDPALVGDAWRAMWLQRLEHMPFFSALWLQHQHRDEYWQHGSVCEDFGAIDAAVLAVGGWADGYSNAIPRLLRGLSAPVRAIIGPWVHKYPHFAVPEPRINFLDEALRWWDHWLKNLNSGVLEDPSIRFYVQESVAPAPAYAHRPGGWMASNEWPPEDTEHRRLYFAPGRLTAKPSMAGTLEIASPQHTGVASGEYCPIWLGPEGPTDQRIDDLGSLCMDTEPLNVPLAVCGAPALALTLRSSHSQGLLAARLCDIRPDGSVTRITYGTLNLCHRNGHGSPAALPTDRPFKVRLQLDDVAYLLPAGHRIRLSLSNAYWPLLWPSAQTSHLRVDAGASSLSLPLLGRLDYQHQLFGPARTATPLEVQTLREPRHQRETQTGLAGRRHKLQVRDDFGRHRYAHGLETDERAREIYRIDPNDPLSASAHIHWREELRRGEWSVRTDTFSHMHSDQEHFYLRAKLLAFENGALIFRKCWRECIPRDLV